MDYFRDLDEIEEAFRAFVAGMTETGLVVTCADDARLDALELPRRRVRYGVAASADWRLLTYEAQWGGGCRFAVRDRSGLTREYRLGLSGRHNAQNALAAIVVGHELGVEDRTIAAALAEFRGTRRRFETRLKRGTLWVVDDYAHHPTAIRATLRAAREAYGGPMWAVFQPHTTSRTAALLDEFAAAFDDADHVVITPIYRPTGREEGSHADVRASDVVARMRHPDARAVGSLDEAYQAVAPAVQAGGMVVTLGAGDITALADQIVACAEGGAP
jgi:UDP-N-acetylmuramate--alanine ligase